MAALLVAMSVMAILLSVAIPTWSQMVRRDKEEELIFRGEQYARAINQYQRKFANQSPSSLDVLIEQRMLRKKFKDPLSPNKDGEFQMLYMSSGTGPQGPQGSGPGMGPRGSGPLNPGGLGTGPQGTGGPGGQGRGGSPTGGPGPTGGGSIGPSQRGGPIVGVASKNMGQSIRLYKGKNRYNEWQFIGMEMSPRAGGPGGAGGGGMPPGGRGPQPGGRGGRGGQDGSDRGGRSGPGTFRPGPADGPNPFGPRGGPTSPPR